MKNALLMMTAIADRIEIEYKIYRNKKNDDTIKMKARNNIADLHDNYIELRGGGIGGASGFGAGADTVEWNNVDSIFLLSRGE